MKTIENQGELWEVFIQSKAGQPFKHVGSIHAFDKNMAIENARDTYTRRGEAHSMWVVKSQEIVNVSMSEAAYFFEDMKEKIYRHPTFYNLPEGVTHM